MSGAKYTPGPWRVCEHSWCDTSILAPNFDHAICSLDINHATEESQEADEALMAANARLIAAAPEMLEALKLAAEAMEGSADQTLLPRAYTAAHAALAKATQEPA